jgi:hypothetical protein
VTFSIQPRSDFLLCGLVKPDDALAIVCPGGKSGRGDLRKSARPPIAKLDAAATLRDAVVSRSLAVSIWDEGQPFSNAVLADERGELVPVVNDCPEFQHYQGYLIVLATARRDRVCRLDAVI